MLLKICFHALLLLVLLCPPGSTLAAEKPLFGLALGLGGREDNAFNEMLLNGMVLARKKFGVRFQVIEPVRIQDEAPLMTELVEKGCSVIFAGGGYLMIQPVEELSRKYPDVLFVLMDDRAITYRKNVASVTFRQNEGSFLAGALAALFSRTATIAFIGASDMPVINDFKVGYAEGARHIKPNIRVESSYVDSLFSQLAGTNPYDAPMQSRKIARILFSKNADVIYAVAGGSGKGVFVAAMEREGFAIGVDSDQDHMAKGYVLTSMMKRLDVALIRMVEAILQGSIENRNYSMGLKEGGVSLSPMTYTKPLIPQKTMDIVEDIKERIIKGDIQVPTTVPEFSRN